MCYKFYFICFIDFTPFTTDLFFIMSAQDVVIHSLVLKFLLTTDIVPDYGQSGSKKSGLLPYIVVCQEMDTE